MIKVSVVMPAYNASATLEEAVNSVINQVYQDWELLIVNDGSKDATQEIAERYGAGNDKITVISLEKNQGLSNARNVGIFAARGEFIAFLDSDDIWARDKLVEQVQYHQLHPSCLISHTGFDVFNQKGLVKRPWKSVFYLGAKKSGNLLPDLYYVNHIGILTVFVKRTVFTEVGGFDTRLITFEDNDLWIRIAEKGYQFGYIDKLLASYRVSSGSLSNSPVKYKKAYKAFIKKYSDSLRLQNLQDKAWGNYYRYFGTHYFKSNNLKLAKLYFLKSINFHKISFLSFSTLIYFLLCMLKIKD